MERDQGSVFGEAADLYDRRRPGYPPAVFEEIVATAGLSPGDAILEVGAGTGLATAELLRRGLRVTALEPSPEMAAAARRRLATRTGLHLVESSFERWEPQGAVFQAVVAAQAWHWVDPALRYERAAAVLPPGGTLALIWNRPEGGDEAIRSELDAVYRRQAPELAARPPGELDLDRTPEILESGQFSSPHRSEFHFELEYSSDAYRELMETQSDHRLLPEASRRRLLSAVAEVIRHNGDRYRTSWVTLLYLSRRLGGMDPFP